jgi:hypothetical protein
MRSDSTTIFDGGSLGTSPDSLVARSMGHLVVSGADGWKRSARASNQLGANRRCRLNRRRDYVPGFARRI